MKLKLGGKIKDISTIHHSHTVPRQNLETIATAM